MKFLTHLLFACLFSACASHQTPHQTPHQIPHQTSPTLPTPPPLILITTHFPVVRNGVTLPPRTPVLFSTAFFAQQTRAFKNTSANPHDRMLRYELGKIPHHQPLSTFGSVSESLPPPPHPSQIEFGQASVTDLFGDDGTPATTHLVTINGQSVKRGKSLAQVADDLRTGRLSPDNFPIHVFHYTAPDGSTHWVTENNRHLVVLRLAKISPTKIHLLKKSQLEKRSGPNSLLSILNRLPALPHSKPSPIIFIRIAGLNDLGQPRNSWNWDAPFGSLVK